MTEITIDFETRSPVDIKSRGAFVYAEHPDTEIMCLSVGVGAERPLIWMVDKFAARVNAPLVRYEMISESRMLSIVSSADKIVAQNSMFEFLIWNWIGSRRHGWPELPLEKLHDTMAQLGYCALPLNLDDAGTALRMTVKKSTSGHKLMLKLCKPRTPRKAEKEADPEWEKKLWWWEDPTELAGLANYCCQDVEAERAIHHRLPKLPPQEREIWLLDQKINLRGVPIDLDSVQAIVGCVDAQEEEQLLRFGELIPPEVVSGPRSSVALKKWLNQQADIKIENVNKQTIGGLLRDDSLPETVKEVLNIRAEMGKSSVSKLRAMINRVSADGRLRGNFVYGGASTLRWSGRAVQLHNLPRDSYKPDDYESVAGLFKVEDTQGLEILFDQLHYAASRCVRGSICAPPGRELVCADYSGVESVGLAYLAGDEVALKAFRDGLSNYKIAAQGIFNIEYDEVTKFQRQVGKVAELQMQYGGGIGAWVTAAAGYGVDLESLPNHVMPHATLDELEGDYGAVALAEAYLARVPESTLSLDAAVACDVIKRKWRASRPAVVAYWKNIETAASMAVEKPGVVYQCGSVKYCAHDDFLKCLMPSGRVMHYYRPEVQMRTTSWGTEKLTLTYEGLRVVDGKTTRQWTRLPTYGPKLVENICQGFCRDFLAHGMLNLEKAGYPVILHVHDEAAAERETGKSDLKKFCAVMTEIPPWAAGIPITAEGWIGKRYRKG